MEKNNPAIDEILRDHGVKPSYQRMRIYEYLIQRKNHPNVDRIYQDLLPEIPTLSRTTVYNTLKLFQERNLLQLLVIEENENRYDADITTHGHFKCERCGAIFDVPVDMDRLCTQGLEGFLINENHIYFKGLCPGCRQNRLI